MCPEEFLERMPNIVEGHADSYPQTLEELQRQATDAALQYRVSGGVTERLPPTLVVDLTQERENLPIPFQAQARTTRAIAGRTCSSDTTSRK